MIVLVTDSTAYISAAEAAALGVMVLPMTYSVDAQAPVNERYVDDNGDFERLIRENPTTLRTSPGRSSPVLLVNPSSDAYRYSRSSPRRLPKV